MRCGLRWGSWERSWLVGELGNDVSHLVDIDKLYPRLEVFVVILPDELGVRCPAEMRRHTLVALLDDDASALHTEMRLVETELPACERLPVTTTRLLGYVELEP